MVINYSSSVPPHSTTMTRPEICHRLRFTTYHHRLYPTPKSTAPPHYIFAFNTASWIQIVFYLTTPHTEICNLPSHTPPGSSDDKRCGIRSGARYYAYMWTGCNAKKVRKVIVSENEVFVTHDRNEFRLRWMGHN